MIAAPTIFVAPVPLPPALGVATQPSATFPPLVNQLTLAAPLAQAGPARAIPKDVETDVEASDDGGTPVPVEPTLSSVTDEQSYHPPYGETPIAVDVMVTAMIAALPQPVAPPATVSLTPELDGSPPASDGQPVTSMAPAAPRPLPIAKAPEASRRDKAMELLMSASDLLPQEARTESSPTIASATITQSPAVGPSTRPEAPAAPVLRDLPLNSDGEWLATIARDIARAADPNAPLAFRLRPEALGEVRIEMTRIDDSTSIRIVTESEAARAALAEGQQRLIAEARSNGVRIADATVLLADSGTAQHHQDRRQNEPNRPVSAGPPPQRSNAPDLANHDPSQPRDRYA